MQEEQSEKALSGEFMERNTVESAIKTETDTRTEFFFKKEWISSVGYVKDINRNIPTT